MEQGNAAKNILETLDIREMVNQRVWIVRNSAVLLSFVTLIIMAIRSKAKDYNRINNKLLEDIQKQNLELKWSMGTFKLDNRNSFIADKPDSGDSLDGLAHLKLREMLDEDTGWQGDREEDEYSDDDDVNNNSTFSRASQRTLGFEAGSIFRETTLTPEDDINLAMDMEYIGSRFVKANNLASRQALAWSAFSRSHALGGLV